MGNCMCFGIKMIVIGALLVLNDQAWLWSSVSAWLLIGIILIVLGALKLVWPVCPVHCKTGMPAKKGK